MANQNVKSNNVINEDSIQKAFSWQSKVKAVLAKVLLYLPILLWAAITLFPFVYMLGMATKNTQQIYANPLQIFVPNFLENIQVNYQSLLDTIPFWRNMGNSVFVGVMATVMTLLFCTLGGYGFAMYDFKGKKAFFRFMLLTIQIPGTLMIIPMFLMMSMFGWVDHPLMIQLWLPGAANAFGFFLMKQSIESTVPRDLVDAARIDGSSELGIYFRVIVPLVRPMMGSLAIVTFISSWNQFLGPLVLTTNKETMTVPVALNTLNGMGAAVDWGAVMLGAAVAVFPIAIIFLIFSRWIIAGMTEGSLAN